MSLSHTPGPAHRGGVRAAVGGLALLALIGLRAESLPGQEWTEFRSSRQTHAVTESFSLAVVYGVAGFRDYDGRFSFSPRLPEGLDVMRFCLRLRGQLLQIEMTPTQATYSLREGDAIVVEHEGDEVWVAPGEPISRSIAGNHSG